MPHLINIVMEKTPVLNMNYRIWVMVNPICKCPASNGDVIFFETLNHINKFGSLSGYESRLINFNKRQQI